MGVLTPPKPCLSIPAPPLPTLPFPLTIGEPPEAPEFDPNLCCKINPFPIGPPPFALPPGTLNPGVVTVIMDALAEVQAFFDDAVFDCPFE